MIFADKLIQLRKQKGWSQEELAEKMEVTRQSVSKWESAQSVPDIERILQLSDIFDVSLDYLLKEDVADNGGHCEKSEKEIRRISMAEAKSFLEAKASTAKPVAAGVLLCILSPVCLLNLGVLSENKQSFISENLASGLGLIVLLVFIAIAVAVFILNGSKMHRFEFMEKEPFETDYGICEMVNNYREQYRKTFTKNVIAGVCFCILAVIPLFCGICINEDDDLLLIRMLSLGFVIAGIGIFLIVRVSIIWSGFSMLLQENDFSKSKKERKAVVEAVTVAYWLVITAIFLVYSFVTNNWGMSWVIWVAAGVLYPIVPAILNSQNKKK
ncbi:MAG: helix-turn-helix domain-containing protein [Eubacterium sp.]|nr:helix-turn-helix domain-containing protein [Eubacterium sp.]